jgi:hypothetical protein
VPWGAKVVKSASVLPLNTCWLAASWGIDMTFAGAHALLRPPPSLPLPTVLPVLLLLLVAVRLLLPGALRCCCSNYALLSVV